MTDKENKRGIAIAQGLDCMPGGVVISRETGELLYVNPYMVAFYDCASEEELREYLADNMYTMVRPEDRESLRQRLQKEEKGRELYYRMRYTVVTKKGRIRHVDAVDRLVVTPEGERLHYGFSLPMSETEVEQDAMTGTRRFLSYASQFLEMYQEGMAMPALNLIFFNVERFKLYNIKYGIEAGNQLIARCAAVLQQVFANDFVFCIADDRFAILTDALRVRDRVQEVREILRQEYSDRVVAFHFGGYRIMDPREDLHQALDRARMACESIRGRLDTYFYEWTDLMAGRMAIRSYVVGRMDEAVQKGGIRPYYQPVARWDTLEPVGFEALARWIDPERGLLMPADFIGSLEDSQQIDKLDRHMIASVCREYRQRVEAGKPVYPVSINLSRLDFFLCDAYEVLEENTLKYGVPRNMLQVEITESLLLDQGLRMTEEMERLRRAGYQVWMDDFGSGYSSLNTLKTHDFDVVKLDRMFLEPFTVKAQKILAAVLAMNHALGIRTLGEGLETEEELDFFRREHCELAQGYLLGRPQPYDESLAECSRKCQALLGKEKDKKEMAAGLEKPV